MQKVSTKNADHYNWGNGCDGWHLLNTGSLSFIQEKVPPGCSEVRHYHRMSHQFFYILEGTAVIEIEGKVFNLNQFEGIEVRPGQAHQLKNESNIDLEFIVVSSPQSHGDRIAAEN